MTRSSLLYDQLLEQADHLATRERRRPRQASLRRAVSSAYYSLFHFLIHCSTSALAGASSGKSGLRSVLARAYMHGVMLKAARCFGSGSLPPSLSAHLGSSGPSRELRHIAESFAALQEQRHRADYDLAASSRRQDVVALVRRAELAMSSWKMVSGQPAADLFLVSLLTWDRLRKR